MVYIDSLYFNKYLFTQFNSTLKKFVGFSEYGIRNAEYWNNGSFLQREIADVDGFCKHNAQLWDSAVREKAGKWHKTLL